MTRLDLGVLVFGRYHHILVLSWMRHVRQHSTPANHAHDNGAIVSQLAKGFLYFCDRHPIDKRICIDDYVQGLGCRLDDSYLSMINRLERIDRIDPHKSETS